MKKHFLAAMFFAMLTVFLWGCGKESAESEVPSAGEGDETASSGSQTGEGSRELPEGYVLSARFEDAGGEAGMHNACMAGSSIYYFTNDYDSEEESHVRDIHVQEKGREARQLLHFGKGKKLLAMTAGEDGSLYFLWGENETENGFETCTLEKRGSQMEEIYSVDATEGMEGLGAVYDMAAASDGKLYGLTLRGIVLCWDENGAFQGRFGLPVDGTTANGQERICFGLANGGEAGIYAFWGGKEGVENNIHLYELNRLQKMSEAELEQAEPLRVNYASAEETVAAAGDMHIYSGYSDGLYMADQNRMWQIDMADGSLEALFQWENINIKAGYLQAVRRQEDGGFLLYIFDNLEQENYWVALEPVPASQIPEKKELVLGVAGTSWYNDSLASKIDQVVLSYNRIHPECHITVKEYEEKAVSDFQLELLKGEGPDILLERQSFFDMDDLSAKGAVEDLMPYLAAAEDVSAEDILPGILDLITKNGKIPRIPLSFAVDVMILPEDMPQEVLTPREMVEYMAQGEDTRIDYLVSPEAFLLQVLSGAEMDHYVDENGRSSSFAGEEFVSLLESLDKLGDLRRISKRGERAELFHAGQLLAVTEEVNCLDDYFCIRSAFSGKGRIAGFPNSAGELRYPAKLYDWMGINSASEHKEEAWSFIAFCLSYTNRSDNVADRFVVLKDKFEQQIRYDKSGSYFIWRNDYDENFEGWQEIASVTPEETELLHEITEHLYFYENKSLFQIINEEAAAFFDGNISSREAAERMQNRANLLLGE